ncbi:MAG TPA: nickel transporter [Alphaproteobacteria bacterium]|nr:nickel transporter [Alphaproteobacteria bacterium]HAJ46699.1 nickel transporter [Alphaproteobacteria bacterium]
MRRFVLLLVLLCGFAAPLSAQHPFGPQPAPAQQAQPTPSAERSWSAEALAQILAWQQDLYRSLAKGLRDLKEQGSLEALFVLLGISFGYGVLHAAGPGHGKVVLSAYLAADDSAVARGIVLAFLSSAAQALTAILSVGILALIFGWLSRDVVGLAETFERISYVLIAGLGLYLIIRAVGGPVLRWLGQIGFWSYRPLGSLSPQAAHGHSHHAHAPHGHPQGDHDHHHEGHHCAHHDHADHLALPPDKSLLGNWRETLAVIVSIGMRPCQGAILVLLFSMAMGVFWAGVLATLAMAVGTAITVAAIAIFTVVARQSASAVLSYRPQWLEYGTRAVGVVAGLILVWIGLSLAWAPPPSLFPATG